MTYGGRRVSGLLPRSIVTYRPYSKERSLSGADRMQSIRILLADRHSLFRQALHELLDLEGDFEVVAEASEESEIVTQAQRTLPDVALVGVGLSEGDGIVAIEQMRAQVPGCRAVVIADGEDPEVLLRAVEAGATGYITKGYALSDLMAAARAAYRGETIVPPSMLGDLLQSLLQRRRQEDEAVARIGRLTRRERQVLILLAEGGNKESIGRALFISPETARTHIQNVLAKLGVHSRLEAATLAMRGNLLSDPADALRVTLDLTSTLPGGETSDREPATPAGTGLQGGHR
jgi:DNA-binding NarL/FixJ family response regulator